MSCQQLYSTIKFGTIKTTDKLQFCPLEKIIEPPVDQITPTKQTSTSPTTNVSTWSSLLKTKRVVNDRGLVNLGNMCFLNAILQPLVHLDSFYNLFSQPLPTPFNVQSNQYLIESLRKFLLLFEKDDKQPIDSTFVYESIRKRSKVETLKGTQEDAQEFLGFLLDGIHQELLLANNKTTQSTTAPSQQGDEWHDIGKNNKKLPQVVKQSAIMSMLGGRLRSVMQTKGKKTISFEPFLILSLPLNDPISTVLESIIELTRIENIEGTTHSN